MHTPLRGVLAVLLVGIVLAAVTSSAAPATPGVFSLDRLLLGGGSGPENYMYTAGDRIFPDGGVDSGSFYRFVVADGGGIVRNPSFPCTPAASFTSTDNTYVVQTGDPVSTGSPWAYTLRQFANSSCTGTPAKTITKNFYVARATAYADAGLTTVVGVFPSGATAYVTVAGVRPGESNWSTTWMLPSSSTACANTAGSDRPESNGSGRLPKAPSSFLQYRPNTTATGSAWNREANYELRPCPAFSSANGGAWKLRLQRDATTFVTLPVFSVDATAPPAPTIDASPPNPSGSSSATFSFSDAEAGVSFRCQLDGGGYAACTSPQGYSGLADGSHTFQVRARDAAGNESAAATYSWSVDTSAPAAPTITSAPPNPSSSSSASFGFSGQAGASFRCQLDGGGYSACTSPQGYSGLADAPHTFQVKARDAAGNESAPASYGWTVDTLAPPTPTIDSAPPNPSGSSNASFGFSDSEGGVSFRCQLDGGGYGACTSPQGYSGLADGSHTFQVKARDAAGNESAPASYSWTINAPPVVTLTTPAHGSSTTDSTPTFSGTASSGPGDSTLVTVKVYLGSTPAGTPVQTLATLRQGSGYSVDASPALADGTYTAQAEQGDSGGGTGFSSANTFAVDATPPPTPTINSAPPNPSASSSASFIFSDSEAGVSFRCQLDGGGYVACTSSIGYTGLLDGPHTFQVKARDAAGNESAPASYSWTINAPPAVTLTTPANGSTTTDSTPTFAGAAGNESGDSTTITVRVYEGAVATGTPVQILTALRQAASYSVDATQPLVDGTYTAQAEQTDLAGNTGLSSANTFAVATARSYRDEVLADNPVSYWRLGETSGTTAGDERGANGGTYTGGVTLGQPGALVNDSNPAASLDGVNDYVVIPDSSSLDMSTAVSVEAWIKRSRAGAWQVVVGKPGNGQSRFENYAIWFNSINQVVAYFGDGVGYVSVAAAIDTNWHHVVATYDNATAKLYVDGSIAASSSSTIHLTANSLPLSLGRTNGGSSYYGGLLDEVAVYPTALSAARVHTHYEVGRAIDNDPPAVVTLDTPAHASATGDTTPTFAGTASTAPGDSNTVTVRLYSGLDALGTPIQTLSASRQGSSYTVDATSALSPGTYTAQAEQADTGGNTARSSANSFAVNAAAPSPDRTLVGAGDIASCTEPNDSLTGDLLQNFPDAVVATFGDNTYQQGTLQQYMDCYHPVWGSARSRTRPSLGDHDYGDVLGGSNAGYRTYFSSQLALFGATASDENKGYYSYDLGTWHVVVLNGVCNYAPACSEALQEQWLRQDLQARPAQCTLAYFHNPLFTSGTNHAPEPRMLRYWNALYDAGAELVMNGNNHQYERFAPQDPNGVADPSHGIREFVVGTGGAELYSFGPAQPNSEVRNTGTYGLIKLTLRPGSFDWQFVPVAGFTFTDSGSQSCHGAPPA
jgi:hypothetical protein